MRITFVCGQDVCIVNANGQNLQQLTSSDVPVANPQWYDDANEILYTNAIGAQLVSSEGQNPRRFRTSQNVFAGPFVSIDGARAAFITPDSLGGVGLTIASDDPSAEHLVSLGIYRAPGKVVWFRDSRQLAVSLGNDVYLADLASGDVRLLCDRCSEPAWMYMLAF
jgi:hypothetical protein